MNKIDETVSLRIRIGSPKLKNISRLQVKGFAEKLKNTIVHLSVLNQFIDIAGVREIVWGLRIYDSNIDMLFRRGL